MEKIYVVSHYYDNGESYEDFMDFEDFLYYSTLEQAIRVYWEKTSCDAYEGRYTLKEVTLDTQEWRIIEKSKFIRCSSQFNDYYADNSEEEHNAVEMLMCNFENHNIHDIYDIQYWQECEEARQEEELIESWLNHKGELYYDMQEEFEQFPF